MNSKMKERLEYLITIEFPTPDEFAEMKKLLEVESAEIQQRIIESEMERQNG